MKILAIYLSLWVSMSHAEEPGYAEAANPSFPMAPELSVLALLGLALLLIGIHQIRRQRHR